jgi:TPR repeat protein
MNLPYSVKLPVIIGLLLLGAAAFTHAHEARKDDVAQVSKQSARLLEVVPIMGPPVAFKNGQLLRQSNSTPIAFGSTDAEQGRLCDRLDSGDPSALATLQAEVKQQHAWAQRVMAMYYLDPRSPLIIPDRLRALQLYRDAAGQGDWSSQYMLGWMLLAGAAFEANYVEARHWLEKSAAQGNSDAMTLIGMMQRDGKGYDTDLAGAFAQFRRAAELENGHAYLDLAAAYANGEGVEADLVQAYKWSLVASRNAGTGNFGKAVKSYLATIAGHLQPQQIDDATTQAKEWLALHPARTG